MKVREIMQPRVTVIGEDETLALASQLMLWNGIRHLPVLRPMDGKLTGMLSERDVLRAQLAETPAKAAARQVREFMSSPVEHVHPDAEVADAAAEFSVHKLRCLPVVEVGDVVGIVTVSDLLATLAQVPTTRQRAANGESIASIMFPEPVAVHPDDSLTMTAERMQRSFTRHACVVDGEGEVIGIISDRDVRNVLGDARQVLGARRLPLGLTMLRVADAMTTEPWTVDQDEPISAALGLFLRERVGALPVVDGGGRLRGIVSYLDVLQHFANLTPVGAM